MPLIKVINQNSQVNTGVIQGFNSTPVSLDGCESFAVQLNVTVNTPSAKTFLSGVAASKVVQDLTYTAATRGTSGNSITVAYTGGGTAGSEVVSVVGNAISIQIQSGVSTATQVSTAFGLSAPATALASVSISGTGSNAQTTVSAQSLTGGINSTVNTSTDQVTITAHGYVTGLKGQLTSTGTLPAGLSTSTDYFIIVIDANTIQFASSLVNAFAGTQIDITNQGSSGATNTFTPTAIAGGTAQMQVSCDSNGSNPPTNWNNYGSAQNITATGSLLFVPTFVPAPGNWLRMVYTITAGQFNCTQVTVTKGPN